VRARIAIVYNQPLPSRYDLSGEEQAAKGVLDAVAAARASLRELGHEVTCLPLVPPLERAVDEASLKDFDLVFNLFEGFCGQPETEPLLAEYLESAGIPFTGCPSAALALCLDKAVAKERFRSGGISTPDFQLLRPETAHLFHIGCPCIVKPRGEDASHGITENSVVRDSGSLESQIRHICDTCGDALVEEYIDGREFNATVTGNSRPAVLPVSEIVYSLPPGMPEVLTFDSKWTPGSAYFQGTRVICPAWVTVGEEDTIKNLALTTFALAGCRGYARVDMRMDREGRLNVIEVNPNPDISPDAGTVRQASAAGMTYTEFIGEIVRLALERRDP